MTKTKGAQPSTLPTASAIADFSGSFTGLGWTTATTAITATSAGKWSTDSKIATDIYTDTKTFKYTAPTQAEIDLFNKLKSAASSTTTTTTTTTPVVPKYTVVSGLQWSQGTMSPTVLGTQDMASAPSSFATKAAFDANAAETAKAYGSATALVASGVVAAVAALAF